MDFVLCFLYVFCICCFAYCLSLVKIVFCFSGEMFFVSLLLVYLRRLRGAQTSVGVLKLE